MTGSSVCTTRRQDASQEIATTMQGGNLTAGAAVGLEAGGVRNVICCPSCRGGGASELGRNKIDDREFMCTLADVHVRFL